MQDLIADLEKIQKYLTTKETEYFSLGTTLQEKERGLFQIKKTRDSLVESVALDVRASEGIKQIFDTVSSGAFGFLENLANQAFDYVFPDEQYKLKIKTGSRGSERTINFLLDDGTGFEAPMKACGGAVRVLISFVFRMYYILRNNLARVVFMDETMSQLPMNNIEPFMGYLNMFVEKYGFKFLWISHNPLLESYATKFYEIYKGKLIEKK